MKSFNINKEDFLHAVAYAKKHLEFTKHGLEITKEKNSDRWLIWNVRNTFLGFYELELVGVCTPCMDMPKHGDDPTNAGRVLVYIDGDMRDDFDILVNGEETFYEGAGRVLTDMNKALRR